MSDLSKNRWPQDTGHSQYTGESSGSSDRSRLDQHRTKADQERAAYREAARIEAARIVETKEDILKKYIKLGSTKEALAKIKNINDTADNTKADLINNYLSEDRKSTIRQYKTETEHKFLKEIGVNTAEDRIPDEIPSKDIAALIIRGTSSVDFIAGTKTKEVLKEYGVPDDKISQVLESLKYAPDEPPAKRRRTEYLSQPQDIRDEVSPSQDAGNPAYQQIRQRFDTLLSKGLDHLDKAIAEMDTLHKRYNNDHKNLEERFSGMSEMAGKFAQGTKPVLDNLKDIRANIDNKDAQVAINAYIALEKAINNSVIQRIIVPWREEYLSTDNPPSASDKRKQPERSSQSRDSSAEASSSQDTGSTTDQAEASEEEIHEKIRINPRPSFPETDHKIRVARTDQLREERGEGSELGIHFSHSNGFELYLSPEVLNLKRMNYFYCSQATDKMNELAPNSVPIQVNRTNIINTIIREFENNNTRSHVGQWEIKYITENEG